MLEYAKTILSKVAFDRYLFEKELKKAMNFLMDHEIEELLNWCAIEYGHLHKPVINLHLQQMNANVA